MEDIPSFTFDMLYSLFLRRGFGFPLDGATGGIWRLACHGG